MHQHADTKKRSAATLNAPANTTSTPSTLQFIDNRPETLNHKKQQETANKSPRVTQLEAVDAKVNDTIQPLPSGKRSKAQMQEDVNLAKAEVEQLVKSAKTTGEVEAYFPMIQEKYRLKHIGFNKNGEIEIEINPKAKINSSNRLISSGFQPSGDRTMKVQYTTESLGGSTVGTKMVANPIGPNHPQGGPPSSSAQKTLMGKLTTDPKQSGEDKYIKGHLLNDNIGGPGIDKNLFPITAIANKKHHDDIERTVKDWVNNKGYWVYYEVRVSNDGYKLNGTKAQNYVNAKFNCVAYPLTANGKEADEKVSVAIISKKGSVKNSTGDGYEVDMDGTSAATDSKFGTYTPELSTSKANKLSHIDDDLYENLLWIFEEAPDELNELKKLRGVGDVTFNDLIEALKNKNANVLSTRTINLLNNKSVDIYAKIAQIYHEMDEDD
ncbi:MAG: hypothetical protein CL843_01015 [Crocinitomicaceae bacterium]|nr:hypothetical protein [Crocinitomicaceae bacterium]|tara:strand:- start:2242 stop:3555 length:1314 start_codon:yes stop_codon:yes gene_type:complete